MMMIMMSYDDHIDVDMMMMMMMMIIRVFRVLRIEPASIPV